MDPWFSMSAGAGVSDGSRCLVGAGVSDGSRCLVGAGVSDGSRRLVGAGVSDGSRRLVGGTIDSPLAALGAIGARRRAGFGVFAAICWHKIKRSGMWGAIGAR